MRYNSCLHVPGIHEMEEKLDPDSYIRMLKLTALLSLANAIDRSHRQKVQGAAVSIKGNKLVIRAETMYDITLEQTIVEERGVFFEEVFGLKPQLRRKRR